MQPVRAALRYSYHRMNFYRSIILAFPANYNGNICDIRRGRSQKKRRGFVRFDEGGLYDERSVGGRTMRAGGEIGWPCNLLLGIYIFQPHHKASSQYKTQTKRKVENTMKTGKITAKLRDTVPICLMVEGEEVKRYENIDLPDMLKEVEMLDFHFNVPEDGKITFEINYPLEST